MEINSVSSAPRYITNFISGNMEQLNKIYEEGLVSNSEGILACKCSEKDNRIDIQFTSEETIIESFNKERWIEYSMRALPDTIRVNPIHKEHKWTISKIEDLGGKRIEWVGEKTLGYQMPWEKGNIDDIKTKKLLQSMHNSGRHTGQEAVSMIPAELINPFPRGWSEIVLLTTFFGGIQIFGIGLIGKYIEIQLNETKKRPSYIIEKKYE